MTKAEKQFRSLVFKLSQKLDREGDAANRLRAHFPMLAYEAAAKWILAWRLRQVAEGGTP